MEKKDLEMVREWRNHPNIRQYMYSRHEISPTEHRTWFERSSKDRMQHLLIVEEDGDPVGFVNLTEIGFGGVVNWGFYAAPGAPIGTGRKLGITALHHAFDQLGFRKLCGQVLEFNMRSIAFHKTLGFREEGVLRDQFFDGEKYHAVICFGLLADEWLREHGK